MTVGWASKRAKQTAAPKLLRGQALSDMSGLRGKVAETCGKTGLESLQIP
jgi:hypothetical protein